MNLPPRKMGGMVSEAMLFDIGYYDLEGIVVKEKSDPYLVEHAAWLKIRNQGYSQWVGREELFERERTPSHKSTTFSPWTKAEQAPPKSQSRV